MEQITQTKPSKTEVEVGSRFVFGEQEPQNVVLDGISKATEAIKLQARMIAFDAIHGTNYRQIHHDVIERQRREAFEASIGLVRK